MSVFLRGLLPALFVAVVVATAVAPPADAAQAASTPEARLLSLINQARGSLGRVPLRWDARLADVAQDRSDYMARTGDFSHLEWSNLISMIQAEGIVWHRLGETLAKNNYATAMESAEVAMRSWRNSQAHWDLLSTTDFNYVAIGMAKASNGWYYWTALLLKGPDRTAPVARMTGAKNGSVSSGTRQVNVGWTGYDIKLSVLTSGLRDFKLQRRVGSGSWLAATDWTTATSKTFGLRIGKTYYFRVRARDSAGNIGKWSTALKVTP